MTDTTATMQPNGTTADGRRVVPAVFDPSSDGSADSVAWRLRDRRPIVASAIVALVGVVVLTALLVGAGLLVTHVFLPSAGGPLDGVGRWDEAVNDWFVAHRTGTLSTVTGWATTAGSTAAVVAIAAIAVVVLAIRRFWQEAGLIVISLSVEVVVFLITTLVVARPRPTVPQLDPAPPTSSFPSGHTAAAVALWISLAIVVSAHVRSTAARALVWAIAVLLPTWIGVARIYRGMHHPTDVIAGLLLGSAAVATGLLAVRVGTEVADRRRIARMKDEDEPQVNSSRAEVAR